MSIIPHLHYDSLSDLIATLFICKVTVQSAYSIDSTATWGNPTLPLKLFIYYYIICNIGYWHSLAIVMNCLLSSQYNQITYF